MHYSLRSKWPAGRDAFEDVREYFSAFITDTGLLAVSKECLQIVYASVPKS